MTAVLPLGAAPDPTDIQAMTGRKPARAGQRGAPRFQMAEATDAGAARGARARKDPAGQPDGAETEAVPVGDPWPVAAPSRATLSPDQAQFGNLPAAVSTPDHSPVQDAAGQDMDAAPMPRSSAQGTVAGPNARPADARHDAASAGDPGEGDAVGRLADAGDAQAPDRAPGRITGALTPSGGQSPGPSAGRSAGARLPEAAGLQPPGSAGADAAAQGLTGRAATSRQTARRDRSADQPAPPAFRLDGAGASGGPASAMRGSPGPGAALSGLPGRDMPVDASGPADILIAQGGAGSGGLDVTIAAATPDLRDRFRATADELQAELSAIGTDVDAIRVELRGELADGGGRAGDEAGPEGGSGGEFGGQQTALADLGWGPLDAITRPDRLDVGPDEGIARGPDHGTETEAAGDDGAGREGRDGAAAQGGRAGRDGQPGREGERLRLLLAPHARAATDATLLPARAGSGPFGGAHRIDRYA